MEALFVGLVGEGYHGCLLRLGLVKSVISLFNYVDCRWSRWSGIFGGEVEALFVGLAGEGWHGHVVCLGIFKVVELTTIISFAVRRYRTNQCNCRLCRSCGNHSWLKTERGAWRRIEIYSACAKFD